MSLTPTVRMPWVTVEELQENFDFILTLVERGGISFLIKNETGDCVLVPYNDVTSAMKKAGMTDELAEMLDQQMSNLALS